MKGTTQEKVRTLALALPEVVEGAHQGTPDFRVRGKIFATLPPGARRACLKATPLEVDERVRAHPHVFDDAWGGRWLGVALDRISTGELHTLLRDAWCRVAPKKLVAGFADEPVRRGR